MNKFSLIIFVVLLFFVTFNLVSADQMPPRLYCFELYLDSININQSSFQNDLITNSYSYDCIYFEQSNCSYLENPGICTQYYANCTSFMDFCSGEFSSRAKNQNIVPNFIFGIIILFLLLIPYMIVRFIIKIRKFDSWKPRVKYVVAIICSFMIWVVLLLLFIGFILIKSNSGVLK